MRRKIHLLAMDVDGTLTDGRLYYGPKGEAMKAFSVKDGMGILMLHKAGIKTAIITARVSSIVDARAKELGIPFVLQGVMDKKSALLELAKENSILPEAVAFVGDDTNDLAAMQAVGSSFAPADAAEPVRMAATVLLTRKGGDGAVRECAELILEGRDTK